MCANKMRALSYIGLSACLLVITVGCDVLAAIGLAPTTDNSTIPSTVPNFNTARFSNPTQIDNPYFPLVAGTTQTFSGAERIVIEVLGTRDVMGVTCRVVRDRVYVNDVLVEDTHDWYAQDDQGNVWYMGETVDDYNFDSAGALIDITHDGSWEAGKDVAGRGTTALPGYIMLASPAVSKRYHQEYYAGEAEDLAEVLGANVAVTLADSTTYQCLKTRDFSSLDPTIDGYKYYAPGIGVVLETKTDGSERVERITTVP